jgi:hypothetical protein
MISSDVSLSSSSNVVFNYPTSFSFRIKNNNDIPKFSYVKIYFPPTVMADNSIYCTYNSLAIGCTYDSSQRVVKTSFFSSSTILQNNLNNYDLIISNLFNPTSTKIT